jgi:hypothetical protein
MWEIYSEGDVPYGHLNNREVMEGVSKDLRLSKVQPLVTSAPNLNSPLGAQMKCIQQ